MTRLRIRLLWFSRGALRRLGSPLDAVHSGLWLGLLDRDVQHELDREAYRRQGAYTDDAHTGRDLFPWEEEALAHVPTPGRVVVLAAGGGRELVALHRRGLAVQGFECNPHLVDYGRGALVRLGCPGVPLEVVARDAAPDPPVAADLAVVGWSGYTLVLGRHRRVALLAGLRAGLPPDGHVLISFYTRPAESRRGAVVHSVAAAVRRLRHAEPPERGDDLVANAVHRFTCDEVRDELAAGGFAMVAFAPQGPGRYDSGWAVGRVAAGSQPGSGTRARRVRGCRSA